eukprot:c11883_g1_i1.p1 GENE.c11883_g1_i1~~c11883_g1_i1.p1  ORF type:complete len:998 (-),score=287.97 c11883_g1_i1:32-2773(-)
MAMAATLQGTPAELKAKIGKLVQEKAAVHSKIRVKLQQLVTEKYELTMRLRQLEQSHVNPLEMQQLRQQLAMLMSEKINLSQKNASQNAALQNAQMWLAQNRQLQAQLERMKRENDVTLEKISSVRSELGQKQMDSAGSRVVLERLRGLHNDLQTKMEEERSSQRNAAAWIQQNEQLRQKLAKLANLNKILAAKVSDAYAAATGNASAANSELSELSAQAQANTDNIASMGAQIAATNAEAEGFVTSVPLEENAKADLIAEVTGLQMQIRQLTRKGEERSRRRDNTRKEMLEGQLTNNNLILQTEEKNAELKKVEDWDAQNDQYRFALQELIDENARLTERLERLEENPTDAGMDSDLDNIAAELMADEAAPEGADAAGADAAAGATDGSDRRGTLKRKVRTESRRKDTIGRLEKRLSSVSMLSQTKEESSKKEYSRLKDTFNTLKRGQSAEDIARRIKEEAERAVDARADARPESDRTYEDGEDTDDIKFVHEKDTGPPGQSRYPQVRAASIEKLVERLTYEKFPDTEYVQAFMLTYRSFTSPLDLLELIIQRYCITPPEGITPADLEDFKNKKQIPIRLRVFNVLRGWINDYFHDFRSDDLLVQTVMDFVKTTMPATGMKTPSTALEKALKRKLKEAEDERTRNVEFETLPPVRPKDRLQSFVKSAEPRLLARVITRVEAAIYKHIEPRECFGLAWSKKNKERDSPNILKLVRRFNETSNWIQWEVLCGAPAGKHAERAKIIKKAVRLAKELFDLNNFNGAMEIISGLQSSAVYRLKNAWSKVDAKAMEEFDELKTVLSSSGSYKALRSALHMANPPCVPYLGMYLTDLTFIEDGNKDTIDGLHNFTKRRYYANMLQEIQRYQQMAYDLEEDPPHHEYLERCTERAVQEIPDENVAYELSLQMEPRGSAPS